MKSIDVNVILTFCSYKAHGFQEIFNVKLSYEKKPKSARELLNQSGFFDTIANICKSYERMPIELVKISTAANWTKNGFVYDIGDGKWSFGSWRGQNVAWSDQLVHLHGFGKDDDSKECESNEYDLNLKALFGVLSAKEAAAAIKKLMGK
jgi:hypothetical protein